MDFINKIANQASGNQADKPQDQAQAQQTQSSGSGSFMDKLQGMAGGGPQSEKKEDALDKGEHKSFPPCPRLVCPRQTTSSPRCMS